MSIRRPSLATRTVSKCSTRSPRRSRARIVVLLVQPLRRDDQGDRPADGLRGRVAEEPLGPGVPRPDDAVERLADDRVLGRLDDGRQPRLGLLGPLALGDVAEDQDGARPWPRPRRGSGRRCRRSAVPCRPGRSGPCGSPARRSSPPAGRGGRGSRPAGGSRSLTMRKTSGRGRPAASAWVQPVSASATRLRNVTRPSASVLITRVADAGERDPQPLRLPLQGLLRLAELPLGTLTLQENAGGVLRSHGIQRILLVVFGCHLQPPRMSDDEGRVSLFSRSGECGGRRGPG